MSERTPAELGEMAARADVRESKEPDCENCGPNGAFGTCPRCFEAQGFGCGHGDYCDVCAAEYPDECKATPNATHKVVVDFEFEAHDFNSAEKCEEDVRNVLAVFDIEHGLDDGHLRSMTIKSID